MIARVHEKPAPWITLAAPNPQRRGPSRFGIVARAHKILPLGEFIRKFNAVRLLDADKIADVQPQLAQWGGCNVRIRAGNTGGCAMSTHSGYTHEQMFRYRHGAIEAASLAMPCKDAELRDAYLSIAKSWNELADKIEARLSNARVNPDR
jgi:hypothetical protein